VLGVLLLGHRVEEGLEGRDHKSLLSVLKGSEGGNVAQVGFLNESSHFVKSLRTINSNLFISHLDLSLLDLFSLILATNKSHHTKVELSPHEMLISNRFEIFFSSLSQKSLFEISQGLSLQF
jgi:hypothetical protein